MKMKLLCLTIVFLAVFSWVECYKILVVFGSPSKSHAILGEGYVRILADAGHEITYITPFPNKKLPKSVRQIDVSSVIDNEAMKLMSIDAFIRKEIDMTDPFLGMYFGFWGVQMLLGHENIIKLINDPKEEFDLAIIEWLTNDLVCGLAAVFNCPFIWSSSVEPHWQVLRLIDDIPNPAYNTDLMLDSITPFTFMERIQQLYRIIKVTFATFLIRSSEEALYQEVFGPAVAKRGRTLPPLDEVRYNGSMILGNSHISTGVPIQLPRHYIDVGGYHIPEVIDPLPENLQKLMDNSKKGVIFFSLGSILQGKDLPLKIKNELIELFAELKDYTIFWKIEIALDNLPKNVHLLKWAPQAAILAHNKTKMFITHGGLLSTIETVRFGVPIIGIPAFGDQPLNMNRAVQKGFGIRVDLSYELAQELRVAVHEMLSNPSYAAKAKEWSYIFSARVSSPRAEIAHWADVVASTRGAAHLRSPALHLPFYQKLYLDALALLVAAIIALIYAFRKVASLLFGRNVSKKQKKA